MQTELTKEIKRALRTYHPLMKFNMRTIRWAEEVDAGGGYVDSIRFEDYVANEREEVGCRYKTCDSQKQNVISKSWCDSHKCQNCYAWEKHVIKTLGIACTCYEIKITKSDFKSNHGHNFVGNFNYYIVPKDLYPQIKDLVPKDIGVITYAGHGYLRKKKECAFKKISAEDLSRYLFNAMKKWCELSYFQLEKFLEGGV